MNGGRYQCRAEGRGCGARSPQWREDKGACLLTRTSTTHDADLQPEPPACFLDRTHVGNMTHGRGAKEPRIASAAADPPVVSSPKRIDWQLECVMRTCVAATRDRSALRRLGSADAQARNFEAAGRRAFVGDDQACKWAIQARWFAQYVPLVDFIHLLSYVWQGARASGGTESEQWDRYARWMRSCWRGRVSEALAEMDREQQRIGAAPEGAGDTGARRAGSCPRLLAEQRGADEVPGIPGRGSVGGQFVDRVANEGDQRPGQGHREVLARARAESVLEARAAVLGDDERLDRHLAARPGPPFQRRAAA